MNRYGKVPSSEVVREAREFLISTNRPETPRHSPGSEKWRDYYESGDGIVTRIDKCKYIFRFVSTGEGGLRAPKINFFEKSGALTLYFSTVLFQINIAFFCPAL